MTNNIWLQLLAVSQSIYEHVKDTHVQICLLSALPYSTQTLAVLRRRLALSFFLSDPDLLRANPNNPPHTSTIPSAIYKLIKFSSTTFRIDDRTDYPRLTDLISILDIGIGPGFYANPILPATVIPTAEVALTSPNPLKTLHYAAPSATKPGPDVDRLVAEAQVTHDRSIDSISSTIRALVNRINDCGAAHMTRTDAKGVLERLLYRLEYGVRCGRRTKTGVGSWAYEDDGSDGRNAQSKADGALDRFIKKGSTSVQGATSKSALEN